ncbi:hypothetical protein AnigIFM63604_007187 [Aspergillus niger]|uniref:HNH nuclease domain-containing protein n=1 Tax=Aspergillus niger TaxID=5061 RepID=A0A9W6A2Z0_ASPNG|nr:hypothetical protein AnigIFM63604_007187 [Aspergillus niger]
MDLSPPGNPKEHNPEDYNELSEERIKLLNRMDALLNHKQVPTAFWAVLVYSDLTELTTLVTESEKSSYLLEFCMHACSVLGLTWRQKEPKIRKDTLSISMFDVEQASEASSGDSREKTSTEKALERDKDCIIRKSCPGEVTHIYPHHLITAGRPRMAYPPFWDTLKFFWGPERLAAWRSQIFANLPYDSMQNLVCLNADLQHMWNDGRFALRPVGYNNNAKTTLKLEFIWQAAHGKTMNNYVPANNSVLSSRNLTCIVNPKNNTEYYVAARINNKVRELKTGDEIVLSTSDPASLPLPSWELLDMAFVLSRIVNLSGAGDTADLSVDDSDDYSLPIDSNTRSAPGWMLGWRILENSTDEAENETYRE